MAQTLVSLPPCEWLPLSLGYIVKLNFRMLEIFEICEGNGLDVPNRRFSDSYEKGSLILQKSQFLVSYSLIFYFGSISFHVIGNCLSGSISFAKTLSHYFL